MKLYSVFTIVILVLLCNNIYAQLGDMPPNPRAGQCYAKCLITATTSTSTTKISVYLGMDSTIIKNYTVDTIITVKSKMKTWVKKRADQNCLSDDPRDCLVWCLEDVDAKTIRVQRYLLDTTITSEFVSQDRDIISLEKEGGYSEWATIVCRHKVTPKLIQRLRNALGMEEDKSIKTLDYDTKSALCKYQRSNDLPVGQLDKKSLKHLKVKWPR